MQEEHRRLVAALRREGARRKALQAKARYRAQRTGATQRMQRARQAMQQQARKARENAEQARRRSAARRRDVLR